MWEWEAVRPSAGDWCNMTKLKHTQMQKQHSTSRVHHKEPLQLNRNRGGQPQAHACADATAPSSSTSS